ncbi:DoxX family protein [Flavobacteriaceae bacterium S0825]|uniref:DoxX family protein n=1 Tax=Gaetbulibacter sp. S0825 TaxID=2720084 RepID=UPI001431922B|nr:DoxX family protein [Gaetbulibacter sp. S0825]MCK0110033.1 DoxX family protein [Flavobacteriaceae bacterium S0825]NIX65662.1 DoxX family protein [Gaetbulibacter sp. S0825]
MFTKNYNDIALAILRIGTSAMMLTHGIPKINRLFADEVQFMDFLGLGASTSLTLALIGEVIAPLFIIFGFRTKLAAIFPIATMLVAFFFVHLDDPFGKQEKALLYLMAFLVIFLAGPGKYSVDGK